MTEKFFRVHGIKKEEAKAPWNKGKGLACLMHFPIPDWAWEKLMFHKAFESLRDAIGYMEAEVGIHVLKIIESEPDVLGGADNKGIPDKA